MKTIVWLLALCAAGCTAPVGVRNVSVPPDAAATCASQCNGIGLSLSSVVIMAEHVGCVCGAAPAAAPAAPGAAAGGMAAIMIAQEQRRSSTRNTASH
jgi:hypothetical protein